MAANKKYRNKFDWELIEAEYRANQKTIVQIAKENGCSEGAIRKRAKKSGWKRDLTKKVREQVRNELVRDEVRPTEGGGPDYKVKERDIVEAAGKRGADVVRSHRNDIKKHVERLETLTDKFNRAVVLEEERQGRFQALKDENSPEFKEEEGKELNRALKFVQTAAAIANSMSFTLKNLVGLERQAWNLDDKEESDDLPTMILHDPKHPERHG